MSVNGKRKERSASWEEGRAAPSKTNRASDGSERSVEESCTAQARSDETIEPFATSNSPKTLRKPEPRKNTSCYHHAPNEVREPIKYEESESSNEIQLTMRGSPELRDDASGGVLLGSSDYGDIPSEWDQSDPTSIHTINPEPELCEEQKDLVKLILDGHNVFYTGPAGCGKSAVLRAAVRELRARQRRVQIIAPTRRAAFEAGGVTLHNFAGWTPASMAKPMWQLKKESHRKKNWKRFKHIDVLIIDEISMVENHLFERLNRVMKDSRKNYDDCAKLPEPFGGIQLIVTGDFCQLPPVQPFKHCMECGSEFFKISFVNYECKNEECKDEGIAFHDTEKWAFRGDAWEECAFEHVNLSKVHRQEDEWFKEFLKRCRLGRGPTEEDKRILLNSKKKEEPDGGCGDASDALPVKLLPLRDGVNAENEEQLALIDKECLQFNCFDNFDWNPKHLGLKDLFQRPGTYENTLQALDNYPFSDRLEMKEGMPVILLINLNFSAGLVNGTQGILVGFEDHDPTKLLELRGAHADSMERLVGEFVEHAHYKKWPIVRFPDNGNQQRTIYPHCMMQEFEDIDENDNHSCSLLSRTQIPLVAGWAVTIHKCQGMTLERAEVHLTRVWEQAQIYVALSRVRRPRGLVIASWPHKAKGPSAQVMDFL